MSLFRAREWWSAKLGEQEEFDKGSMAVGNVDNDPDNAQVKIVTGSFQGMLRVHHPKQPYFRIEDLLLEQDLGAPILQVTVGRFIPAAPQIESIAVLHPRRLVVYTLEAIGGQGVKASYFNLTKAYEHVLGEVDGGHFTAYNMTHGGFGGVSRDLLCVQSMDGRLQVFEQDAHAFTRRLHRIMIPGPMCYVAKIDAIVVGNSEMGVDCYKYQALAASQGDREEGKAEGISTARGLQAYWSCRLGERVLDLFVAKFSRSLGPGCVDIVVLGEMTLFTLREQGTIRLQKMLGYQPACGCKYTVAAAPGEEGERLAGTTVDETDVRFSTVVEEENLIVAADTDVLLVYKDMQLVWQAAVSRAAVALAVVKVGCLPGLICSLDDGGVLSICYQGTDPPTSAVMGSDSKEVDYDHINLEHRKLLQVIHRSQINSTRPPAGKLTLKVQVPRFLDPPVEVEERKVRHPDSPGRQFTYDDADRAQNSGRHSSAFHTTDPAAEYTQTSVTVRFVIGFSGTGELRDATLNVSPPAGISACPSSVVLTPVRGTGIGSFDELGNRSSLDPCVVPVVFRTETGTGRTPSTILGHASVVYTRPSSSSTDGANVTTTGAADSAPAAADADIAGAEPMSARCDVRLPLAMAVRVLTGDSNTRGSTSTASEERRDGGEEKTTSRHSTHKIIFATNESPVPLSDLFEDILSGQNHERQVSGRDSSGGFASGWISSGAEGAGGGPAVGGVGGVASGGGSKSNMDGDVTTVNGRGNSTASSLSFRYWAHDDDAPLGENPHDVSIAVSKNSGKYRLQSASLAALCVVSAELLWRLKGHFGDDAAEGRRRVRTAGDSKLGHDDEARLTIEYTEALPLSEFYGYIDDHFDRRKDLLLSEEKLNAAAHQYRVIEKRLLARFKDRNPAPLDRLDVVSEETYVRLVELGEEVQRAQRRLAESAGNLACAVRLMALLIKYRFQLGSKDYALLLAHLQPDVIDTDEQGWEEMVDAAVTHLLRTTLAKVAKDSVPIPASGHPPLAMPHDTAKLKKHISIVCDRLSKGARLVLRPVAPPSTSPQQTASPTSSPPSSPFSQRQRQQEQRWQQQVEQPQPRRGANATGRK